MDKEDVQETAESTVLPCLEDSGAEHAAQNALGGEPSSTATASADGLAQDDVSQSASLSKSDDGSSRGSSVDRSSPGLASSNSTSRTALDEKRRKREECHIEGVMKTLRVLDTPEEKLTALCTKYVAVVEENRLMKKTLGETQKLYTNVLKEKDRLDHNLQRTLLAKGKLETLCRELQKCNRAIKQENAERFAEYEASRKELSDKFHKALSEIHTSMDASKERSETLTEENRSLAKKLQLLVEQYDAREEHTKKLIETRDLESKLYEAKLQAANLKHQQILEEKLRAEAALLQKMKERDDQVREALENEKRVKEQLGLYSAKYDELQNSLGESNQLFDKFKAEMEKMNAKMIKVERESRKWRSKFEESSKALIDATESKVQLEEKMKQQTKSHEQLEKLTRALQEERVTLLKELSSKKQAVASAADEAE